MERSDWIDNPRFPVDSKAIRALRNERRGDLLNIAHWDAYRKLEAALVDPGVPLPLQIESGSVAVGDSEMIDQAEIKAIEDAMRALIPWRKGPFSFFGSYLDAEWRSDHKWNRIRDYLDPLRGKRILDIGCNNGYYMFRMAESDPELVVGIDPSARCLLQFELAQRFLRLPQLYFELFGIEDVELFPNSFHIVLCMGIVYHNRSPLLCLQKIHECMRPNGQLLLESLALPGEDPIALCSPDRYAKMRNVWFLPTASCMASWLKSANFVDIEVISSVKLEPQEQRRTEYAPWESLEDFLDPTDPSKTREGYPAPLRVALTARKRKR